MPVLFNTRAAAILAAGLSAAGAFGDPGILGTKSGGGYIGSGDAPAVGPMPIIQMLIALGIVLALVKWLLPKALSKVGKKLVTPVGSGIAIEESAAFSGGSLYIVKARGKELLVCVSSSGVSCLADLGTQREPVAEPTFQEMVETAKAAPAPEVELALERLVRLGG
jgi:hypothetical protein